MYGQVAAQSPSSKLSAGTMTGTALLSRRFIAMLRDEVIQCTVSSAKTALALRDAQIDRRGQGLSLAHCNSLFYQLRQLETAMLQYPALYALKDTDSVTGSHT